MNAVNNKITATRYSSSPSPSWTVEAVKKIISKTDPQLIKIICNEKIKIISFETAYDKWKYSEGGIEENKVTGLLGHTKREKMEIWLTAAMTNELAAITLFHEMGHITRMPPTTHEEAIDEEINVRVETEAFAIRQSMPNSRWES
jgi:Zn-dependent peptidase ImmA (M78 family)